MSSHNKPIWFNLDLYKSIKTLPDFYYFIFHRTKLFHYWFDIVFSNKSSFLNFVKNAFEKNEVNVHLLNETYSDYGSFFDPAVMSTFKNPELTDSVDGNKDIGIYSLTPINFFDVESLSNLKSDIYHGLTEDEKKLWDLYDKNVDYCLQLETGATVTSDNEKQSTMEEIEADYNRLLRANVTDYRSKQLFEFVNKFIIKIDINAPEEVLLNEFRALIKHFKSTKTSGFEPNIITQQRVDKWIKYRVIPYVDLLIWSYWKGHELTEFQAASIIFSDLPDVDGTSRISKHTKKYTNEVFSNKWISLIKNQTFSGFNTE